MTPFNLAFNYLPPPSAAAACPSTPLTLQTARARGGGGGVAVPAGAPLQPHAGRVLHPQRGRHIRLPRLRRAARQQGQGAVGALHRGG